MKTTLRTDITVRDICEGFVYDKNEGKGLYGWGGQARHSARVSTSLYLL